MILFDNESKKIKNRDRRNYFHHTPMLILLGDNHCLMLLHMDKRFIWIAVTGEHMNDFDIIYMNNPSLYVNKAFKEKV